MLTSTIGYGVRGDRAQSSTRVAEPLPNSKQVGAAIRKIREAEDDELTIEALAQRAGLSTSYLSDIEHMKREKPSWNKMVAIIDALGVDLSTVIAKAQTMPREPQPDAEDAET